MIKLNNKNITYVAFADSNNSLKAPKEIWYADSNNSVKLVYRRKDALIEGEDYEKYHWLKTTEYAYINTKIKGNQDSNVEVIAIQYTQPTTQTLTFYGSVPSDVSEAISLVAGITAFERTSRFGNRVLKLNNFNLNQEYDIIQNKDALIVNGSTHSNTSATNNFESGEIYVFASNIQSDITPYINRELSIRKFIINDAINLIPCKLLKPVPKWLDANGIRRQVGECGMIDLVSGKFYGNVNSNGTFTVENYYERKEWLIADIPDNKRCIDLPINSNEMSYSMLIQKVGNNTLFETIGNYRYYTTIGTLPSIKVWNIATSSDTGTFNVGLQTNKVFNITSNESSLTINGVEVQKIGFPISAVVLRSGATLGNAITETSSIFVDGVERYIPCTLTMDLPASMDANNIARTKGTSGMWDLVSDRFYGNIASSGTFKAVNLAEGVDYEVHQWLVVQYIGYEQATLPIQSNDFNYKYKFYSFGNIGGVLTTNNNYIYYSNVGSNGIWGKSERYNVYRGKFYELNTEISINCDANGITMDGELMPNYGSSPYFDNLKIYCYGSTTAKYALSSITVDGIERYIPVKLLKSIPAKYDANGIARQAGECGMYDTVNDKFYGNVASSGAFSVSDDS